MKPLTILITGATAGIGRTTALALAKAGHRVFAAGRRKAQLDSLEKEGAGLKLEGIVMDVTKAESVAEAKKLIDARTDGYGVDALVNNAGFGMLGPLEDLGDERLRAQFETNVFGLMSVTRTFLPQMRERGFGRIVNVSSMGGRMTFPLMGAYNATKYAVESLSDALRNEVHAFGIGVSLVEPGYIRTEFADVAISKLEVTPGSPFAPLINKASELLELFEKTGVGPEHVSRAIRKAIESRSPSARYVAPWRTYMALWLITILPTSWIDAAFRSAMGLTKRNLAKQLSASKSEPVTV